MKTLLAVVALLLVGQDDALVQANEKRIEKYRKTLEKTPDDPEAAYQVGRHLCFLVGDWTQGLPFLARGKDKDLSQLARYELGLDALPADPKSPLTGAQVDFGDEAAQELVLGDMLWEQTKKCKEYEFRTVMNRAIWRYRAALSKTGEARRRKLLDRISKVMDRFRAMYTHPGKVLEGPPKGWGVVVGKNEKIAGVAVDESKSRTGRSSLKVTVAPSGLLVTNPHPVTPGEYTLSLWYLSEGTVASDLVHVLLYDKKEDCTHVRAPMPPDQGGIPMWERSIIKFKVSDDILQYRLYIDNVSMREGSLWVDDLVLRGPSGKEEPLLNGGFEER